MGANQYSPNMTQACKKSIQTPPANADKYAEDVENEQACIAMSSKLKTSFKKQYTASKNIMNSKIKKQLILKNNRHNRYRKLMETPTNESIQSPDDENRMAPIYEAINRIRVITPAFRMIEVDPKQFILMRQTSILKDYDLLKQIGKGSFGSVFRAKERITGQLRAVKKISKQNLSYQARLSLINEFQILRKLDHPNIIKLYEMYDEKECIYVVTQLCEGGNLLEYVTQNKSIPQDDIRDVMKQLLGAVRYMHDCKILHRDIKLENIVLIKNKIPSSTQRIQIKLIDFGISIDLAKDPQTETDYPMGTLLYMSPESIQNKLMLPSDVYSCGIVLYIMATRRIPFLYFNESELMHKIQHGDIVRKYLSTLCFDLKLFLARLIEKNPKKRIKASAAIENVWLTKGSQRSMLTQTKRIKLASQMLAYDAKNNLISLIQGFLVCRTINQEQRQRLATQFQAIDENKSGVIQVEQFKKFYHQNSQHYDSTEIEQLAQILDKNKSGNIDFNEFITAMYSRRKLFQIQSLEIAFDFLDKDNSGGLSKAELQEILKGVQHEEMEYLFKQVDKNEDQFISKAEFLQYFKKYQQ